MEASYYTKKYINDFNIKVRIMTSEQIGKIQKINFEIKEKIRKLTPSQGEEFACILERILAGILPIYFNNDDISILREIYGEKWYEVFSFTDEDMKED